jgi:hypothetical protein
MKHANIVPMYGYAEGELFGDFGALISPVIRVTWTFVLN